jgi:hypothetical protein
VGLAGPSLFFDDAMITPAISVLSAVEGLRIVPPMVTPYMVPIAAVVFDLPLLDTKPGEWRCWFPVRTHNGVWFVTLAVVRGLFILCSTQGCCSLSALTMHWLMPAMSAPLLIWPFAAPGPVSVSGKWKAQRNSRGDLHASRGALLAARNTRFRI